MKKTKLLAGATGCMLLFALMLCIVVGALILAVFGVRCAWEQAGLSQIVEES